MAPEVHSRSNYDSKADVWSLGMTILEMLEGNVPKFDQRTMRMMNTSDASSSSTTLNAGSLSVNEYIERCPASKDLRDFVSLCLNTNPDLRPTSIMLLEVR
jgi:serine/threonine protein kinase